MIELLNPQDSASSCLMLCHVGGAIQVEKSRRYNPKITPISVLELPLVQGALLNLDLLIQQCKLIVTAYELRTKNVSLTNHNVILLLLPQLLL